MTGENVVFWINEPVVIVKLLFRSLAACFTPSQTAFTSIRAQLSRQILYTGVEALWLVGIIAFLCGVVIVIQA